MLVCVRYLKPGVYLDGLDALHQGLVDFGPVAVVKPQSQNPDRRQRTVKKRQVRCGGLFASIPHLTTRGRPISTFLITSEAFGCDLPSVPLSVPRLFMASQLT